MYDISVKCTYKSDNVFLSSDNISNDEKEFVRDAIYRQELCNIFQMEDYDGHIIDKELTNIYEKMKHLPDFYKCIKIAASKFIFPDDDIMGMSILYSFDYMDLTHICVSEFLQTNNISNENLQILKKRLECN